MTVFCELDSGGELPEYTTPGAAGADLRANIEEPIALLPGQRALIPTGIKAEIPEGYELQVRPRSGLALKHGITVLNSPGTIDSDYRGEIRVILINFGDSTFIIEPKMRIAQVVLSPVVQATFVVKQESLAETARGSGGFGHTGAS
ncbi:deoxyuridine 5-triphosphate nucleotidohydrolase [Chlamydia pneumoniae TW-183]|uniref:Deoxyuridine 5'-triphosphate nucleotidohydrolase n=2 Tax=Chlamydia pneumoniae TaxID=83558 RepID=DUT_CHLPN|nr:dUTP diphosphatase [Chlamydia pneumoniae]Q9Z9C2.1 RecName: Full=Deoxyuridine 5'-triphosphate nucleotidohydrolase; Short=dUTPase; AltName: Full=dUTP pyrophosphatase [Chlamydia pneumoniae]AAD18212.1 dUTP Nucleotidohydrolase [Chlamydia pneumoniae CWL029]AAF38522.1 deoxyuridine 5`-triphosphate nucleotidohydrolase [Chlamydia pneumoniae AR39]AAP97993.1 deoxyuridine 5-triphosphate nucleotidohydrolase [Chlamydia pneumoniae TW-183]ACZ33033.1 dUTP diphosphatase [Chlamydia pneumoniae LPCoLN]ETR79940.